jgi:DNA repair exonuclease SbcCD nuclease subunit
MANILAHNNIHMFVLSLLLTWTPFNVTSLMMLNPTYRSQVGCIPSSVCPHRWPTHLFASFFHVGESVTILPRSSKRDPGVEMGDALIGRIHEVRGGGWYSVALIDTNLIDVVEVIKCRSTQLRSSKDVDGNVNTMEGETSRLPTILNYDVLIQADGCTQIDAGFTQQLQHFSEYQTWVVFTDLHCATSTLETCLEVLQKVHKEAVDRDAGILFLGDWWHVRGSLRVDLVNSVLSQLSTWTQPMIMIPGNHDQTSWHTNEHHALRIFQNAYRIKNTTVSGVLVLSYPTIFMNALFIPYVRSPSILESILSTVSKDVPNVFCHCDITGSSMNDNIVSKGGISPLAFAGRNTYTGHFHKPHTISDRIVYLGSPYEVSLAEAEQDKAIVVLDRSHWSIKERISMNKIGKKHYKPTSIADIERVLGILKAGDRVVYTQPRNQIQSERDTVESYAQKIRRLGAVVEVRPAAATRDNELMDSRRRRRTEHVPPSSLWRFFLDQQVDRGLIDRDRVDGLFAEGLAILEEVEKNSTVAVVGTTSAAKLQLETVYIRGFGPFVESQTYKLNNKGLVLLRGVNEDDGADR